MSNKPLVKYIIPQKLPYNLYQFKPSKKEETQITKVLYVRTIKHPTRKKNIK